MKPKTKREKRYEQILLLGCDVNQDVIGQPEETEKDRCQRSDLIIVLSLDKVTGKLKMIDLMRDVWVPIPGYGMGKLNSPVVYGGPELAVRVINRCFDLGIRKYVQITINDLVDLVDLFGGVDIDLSIYEAIYINVRMPEVKIVAERDDDVPRIMADGMNHLNGMQTLAHVRNRTVGSIKDRENRGNDVLKAMARRARDEMSPRERLRFALQARKYVRTDLNVRDIVRLLRFGRHIDPDTIEVYHAPAEGTYEVKNDRIWRMETDFEKAGKKIWEFIEKAK